MTCVFPDTTQLCEDDEAEWLDTFTEVMGQPSQAEEVFHARRQSLGRGVGLDSGGKLVYADVVPPR